jgi:predicted MFS family arabinose efflux permease
MGRSFGKVSAHTGVVAVATQVGYASGMVLFVPLGDVIERRGLMVKMFAGVAAALVLAALAPSLAWLAAASLLVGLLAAVTHIAVPIAPDLVGDKDRGHAIGTVMTGLLLGILLARTFAGWLSALVGWRGVFWIAAAANAAFIPLLLRILPKFEPKAPTRYADALRSLWTLFRSQPALRESCLIGGLIMAAFTAFWTTLVFMLGSDHYHLGAGVAGSFGILGATGALIAPMAGRLSDQRGPRYVIGLALTGIAISFVVLWAGAFSMFALVAGVILMDLGVQANQISNQTRIFGLMPEARSRINTVYMTAYFAGASLGSLFGTIAWARWQWTGVCGFGLLATALAGLRHANPLKRLAARPGLEPG